MPDNIDKTRIERIGERSFTGSGVDTIPDIMEENIDLRQQIQDMINEALANVTGAVTIQDVPDQITYQFGGGGVSQAELNAAISNMMDLVRDELVELYNSILNLNRQLRETVRDTQNQINNLESGTGSVPKVLCRMYLSGNQAVGDGNETLVEFDTSNYDPQSVFNATTHKVTIPSDGYYLFTMKAMFGSTAGASQHKTSLASNVGVVSSHATYSEATKSSHQICYSDIQYLTVDQTAQMQVQGPAGGYTMVNNTNGTWMTMAKVGNV